MDVQHEKGDSNTGTAYFDEREARSTMSLTASNVQKAGTTNQQAASKELRLKSGELKLASKGVTRNLPYASIEQREIRTEQRVSYRGQPGAISWNRGLSKEVRILN